MRKIQDDRLPKDAAMAKIMITSLLEKIAPNMETLRDIEWIQEQLDNFKGQGRLGRDAARQIKATGITRPADPLGRVVIPMEIRRSMGINPHDEMEIYLDTVSGFIVLQPHRRQCHFCGNTQDVSTFREKHICEMCLIMIHETV